MSETRAQCPELTGHAVLQFQFQYGRRNVYCAMITTSMAITDDKNIGVATTGLQPAQHAAISPYVSPSYSYTTAARTGCCPSRAAYVFHHAIITAWIENRLQTGDRWFIFRIGGDALYVAVAERGHVIKRRNGHYYVKTTVSLTLTRSGGYSTNR